MELCSKTLLSASAATSFFDVNNSPHKFSSSIINNGFCSDQNQPAIGNARSGSAASSGLSSKSHDVKTFRSFPSLPFTTVNLPQLNCSFAAL